jgi:tetrahydromethanopterin S-methyltransferase subunit G
MKFNMDLKTLVFIVSTACILAGFYYTTKARLDEAEREISFIWSAVGSLQKENKRLNRQIRSLKKEKEQPK